MFHIQNLEKYYGSSLALQIGEMNVQEGIHWVKGPNGSGKTTFFKILAALLPFKGKVVLDQTLDLRKKPVAYRMLVNYGEAEPLYPDFLTGLDLIRFVASAKKAPEEQIKELSEQLGIGDFVTKSMGSYSSGMTKKLSLLLAFLGKPRWIILDEPLITLDQQAIANVYRMINEYHQERGTNFLLSSHQHFSRDAIPIHTLFEVANKTIRIGEPSAL